MAKLSTEEFMKLVARMRSYQKAYFQHRNQSDLARAKKLEAQVDRWLDRNQGELF